jgi:hypothetical protein
VERLGKPVRGWLVTALLLLLSILLVTIIRIGGLPLSRWLISLNANFSIPLTVALIHKICQKAFGKEILPKKSRLTLWVFGIVMGILLYPMALGLGGFDPYALGWEFSILFVLMFFLTFGLLYVKDVFGIVLMISILSFNLELLESSNFWDYLVDPFYFFIALGLGLKRMIFQFKKKKT